MCLCCYRESNRKFECEKIGEENSKEMARMRDAGGETRNIMEKNTQLLIEISELIKRYNNFRQKISRKCLLNNFITLITCHHNFIIMG